MDARRIDALARLLGGTSRRRLLASALAGGLSLVGIAAGEAKKHKKKKRKKKTCKAQPVATTCAGKCGAIKNNCGQAVDCTCPTGACCSGDGTCGACVAFATSTKQWGDLDGLRGADAVCQNLAAAAGLPGDYMAWLGDTTGSPSTRFVRATVPYTLVDGTVIASNWTDLTDGQIAHAINVDEQGRVKDLPQPWTNVNPDGTAGGVEPGAHCDNWTSSLGGPGGHVGNAGFAHSQATNAGWTKFRIWDCNLSWELYCFQQR